MNYENNDMMSFIRNFVEAQPMGDRGFADIIESITMPLETEVSEMTEDEAYIHRCGMMD